MKKFRKSIGDEEVVTLKQSNIRKVARRSGKPIRDLELMLAAGEALGKTYTIKYKVVSR